MALANVADHGDSCLVDVLGCDHTFFEKLTVLHEINNRGVEKLGERQSRHIYDVISIHETFPGFIEDRELLAKVVRHKKSTFDVGLPNGIRHRLVHSGKCWKACRHQ